MINYWPDPSDPALAHVKGEAAGLHITEVRLDLAESLIFSRPPGTTTFLRWDVTFTDGSRTATHRTGFVCTRGAWELDQTPRGGASGGPAARDDPHNEMLLAAAQTAFGLCEGKLFDAARSLAGGLDLEPTEDVVAWLESLKRAISFRDAEIGRS